MKTTLLILLCCATVSLRAQISGRVTDSNNQPIEYVNVALYRLPDTLFVTGAVTNSLGRYAIPAVTAEDCLLRATMVGYKTSEAIINATTQSLEHHFILEPDENMLQELVVEGVTTSTESRGREAHLPYLAIGAQQAGDQCLRGTQGDSRRDGAG